MAQLCRLAPRQILQGLAVLVQAGFICHHTTTEGRTSYEANSRNAYWLVRTGKIIDTVHKRYGKAAAAATTQLLLLGHASIGHLRTSSRIHQRSVRTSDVALNGGTGGGSSVHGGPAQDHFDAELSLAIRTLIKHGLICRLRRAYLRTDTDNYHIADDNLRKRLSASALKGTKAKEESLAKIKEVMEDQKNTRINLESSSDLSNSRKRKINPTDDGALHVKRPRLTCRNAAQETESIAAPLLENGNDCFSDSLIVRLNYAKFVVLCRNSRLTSLVANTYGRNVSRTYSEVLKQLDADQPDVAADSSILAGQGMPQESSKTINEERLAQDLFHSASHGGSSELQLPAINGHINGVTPRLTAETCSHLEILCEQPFKFLSHSLEHPDKYEIELFELGSHLRNDEIFRIILARFDKHAVRIVRALLDKGKVDEKYLQEIVLMPVKELRQSLARLKQAGFVELQEVPREAQRQPSRTMYLWFFDPDRVSMMLTEHTYKCMARCMQRIKAEREKVKPTIEKSERSDVKGQEEKMLAKAELEALRAWRRKESRLLGEVGRLDELILVLRDF